MTPDTIGIFISYLIQKLYVDDKVNTIIDPVIGTGNLVYTIVNQLNNEIKVFGVDHDFVRCNLARNFGDLMQIKNQVFYQDTLKYFDQGFDLSVMDLPINQDPNLYVPYQIILHHLDSIKPGKFMISLIENDFFEQKDNEIFKQEVNKKANIYGLIKLSESLFKSNPKSILILQKKGANVEKTEKFLLVDLPSFSDETAFASTIKQIDQWFETRRRHVK
jgi:site-specific DNA-methyltransferase (adenine-specific)